MRGAGEDNRAKGFHGANGRGRGRTAEPQKDSRLGNQPLSSNHSTPHPHHGRRQAAELRYTTLRPAGESDDDYDYPQPMNRKQLYDCLYELEKLFKHKHNRELTQRFGLFLSRSSNPYADTLTMIESSSGLNDMKTVTLACTLAKEFTSWLKSNTPNMSDLTGEIQHKAFQLATRNQATVFPLFFDLLSSAYQLCAIKNVAVPFCHRLIDGGKLKVIGHSAVLCNESHKPKA